MDAGDLVSAVVEAPGSWMVVRTVERDADLEADERCLIVPDSDRRGWHAVRADLEASAGYDPWEDRPGVCRRQLSVPDGAGERACAPDGSS